MRERAGLIDRSERGKIEVTGKDRATFLHGLVSSDVKGLAPGQGSESALLDVHEKVTALLAVYCLPDRLILETDRELAGPLLTGIDRYLFSERAELEDVTPASGILTVAGPLARKTVEQALGEPVPDLARWHHVVLPWTERRCASFARRRRERKATISGRPRSCSAGSGTDSGRRAPGR